MSKEFMTEVAQGPKKFSVDFMYETVKITGGLKTSLSKSFSGVQREIANCVAKLYNQLACERDNSSVMFCTSRLDTSAAAADTAPSTSAGLSSKGGSQYMDI